MRALVVAPYVHPEGGGLERYASRVGRELARRGHEVTLLGHARDPRDEVVEGVRTIAVRATLRLSNAPLSAALRRAARQVLREARHDVVHAHSPVPGAAETAWRVARRERVPFVLTYHAGALRSGRRLFALAARAHAATLERAMIRSADARVAVSRFVAGNVAADLPWLLAPPGVDLERFHPEGQPEPGRVLFVGPVSRAYAWKGLAVLAQAIQRVPGAALRIVGDGDLLARYQAIPGVEVVGRVSDARLADEYRAASVVALPSLTDAESFGMTLAEANACGRPVVASRVGGIPCFVRDGVNGLLAPPGDAAALARAIAVLLADPGRAAKMGANGRRIVEAEHRWEGVASRTLEAYAIAASARASRRRRPSAGSTRAP